MGSETSDVSISDEIRGRVGKAVGRIEESVGKKHDDDFEVLSGRVRQRKAEARLQMIEGAPVDEHESHSHAAKSGGSDVV
ncbi:hypothetical protein GCM10009847_06710 [Leucobacter tardus]